MKSLMLFFQEVLAEAGTWCHISTLADLKTIRQRFEHEGVSFLTITLPTYGKAFERALDTGWVDPTLFAAFAFQRGLPRLFGGFLELVFDRDTGRLLDDPSVDAIRIVRQLTLLFGKMELECTSQRTQAAYDAYVQCESDIKLAMKNLSSNSISSYQRIARLLWAELFSEVDNLIYEKGVLPKHGSGATADKLMGNQKLYLQEWSRRLETEFPHSENLVSSWRYLDRIESVDVREPGDERPAVLDAVPKTLKTPRIISKEPSYMQYVQLGLLERIREGINRTTYGRALISFESQEPNRLLALEGSLTGELATLDLSEASDRVSNELVQWLLLDHPTLMRQVDSCRSRTVRVPGHGDIAVSKFASMGSGLCFPFESLVFMTIVFYGIEQDLSRNLSRKDVQSYLGQVRTFGDDIIVPVRHMDSVARALETFGLKVNLSKSFGTGKFRESCGADYYNGHDVTVTRVRNVFPTQRTDASEMESIVSLRNQLYKTGWWKTVKFLDDRIGRLTPFPAVAETSSALGKYSFLGYETQRMHRTLHKPLVRASVARPRLPKNQADDYAALLKYFLLQRGDSDPVRKHVVWNISSGSEDHLERSGRVHTVDIKVEWVPAY